MVGEPPADLVREGGAAQRVAHLQVFLAASDLAGVTPRWRGVVAIGVVLPLSYLVRERGNVRNAPELSYIPRP